ncbi:hypothetical protein T1815_16511 [Agathobacter rectalis]|uniref:Uncharacterized protein n=1 Tax=Agathobacter rectalis TaxID=39491 RepID=A0A0M6WKZ6_9FIRM|nr:hypothetical protein T1815_16511 [Agathobacter rectalis]
MIFCKFLTAKFMFSKLTKIQPVRKITLLRTGCIFGQFCKLEVIALLLLYLSQNTFYYKCYCYKGSYKGIVV